MGIKPEAIIDEDLQNRKEFKKLKMRCDDIIDQSEWLFTKPINEEDRIHLTKIF
jgi:hypothetical protein